MHQRVLSTVTALEEEIERLQLKESPFAVKGEIEKWRLLEV